MGSGMPNFLFMNTFIPTKTIEIILKPLLQIFNYLCLTPIFASVDPDLGVGEIPVQLRHEGVAAPGHVQE